MESTLAHVSSKQLKVLQAELKRLSVNILETYDTISFEIKGLAEKWCDDKYDEFQQEFKSCKEEIREIAERYEQWANSYLPPRIEQVEKIENRSMGRP